MLVPQVSSEHNWSLKFKKWVILVILLIVVCNVTYVANGTIS